LACEVKALLRMKHWASVALCAAAAPLVISKAAAMKVRVAFM
jgi:hypothetical protein